MLRRCRAKICRLYHLIALALRAYVLSWYTRISPRDRALLPSINSTVITPLLRPILTSIYHDSSSILNLILLDLPTILHLHITNYRQARHQESLDLGSLGDAYHARVPLLSVAKKDETWQLDPLYLTSLADGILKNGLSVDEYGSSVERLMVRELIGRVILGGVGKKLCEAWFWYGLLLRLLSDSTSSVSSTKDEAEVPPRRSYVERITFGFSKLYSLFFVIWTTLVTTAALYSSTPTPRPEYRQCMQPWLSVIRTLLEPSVLDGGHAPIVPRLLLGSVDMIAFLSSPVLDR